MDQSDQAVGLKIATCTCIMHHEDATDDATAAGQPGKGVGR
jgi:hypothetical protein